MGKFSGTPDPNLSWTAVDADELDLTGKRVAIVGGTGGIGRALALTMAARGAEVVVVGRTFRDAGTPRLTFVEADLASMAAAREVGRTLPAETLDAVVLTNGIMSAPEREQTAEGIERDLAVSYLSRLAILRELAPRIGRQRDDDSTPPRVFVMGFPGTGEAGDVDDFNSERSYRPFTAHMNTVAGNEALVLDLAQRHPELDAFGLNPGLIQSGIRSNYLGAGSLRHRIAEWLIGLLRPSADAYARRMTPLMFSPTLAGDSGTHINAKGVGIRPSTVMTPEHVQRVIAASETLLATAAIRGPG